MSGNNLNTGDPFSYLYSRNSQRLEVIVSEIDQIQENIERMRILDSTIETFSDDYSGDSSAIGFLAAIPSDVHPTLAEIERLRKHVSKTISKVKKDLGHHDVQSYEDRFRSLDIGSVVSVFNERYKAFLRILTRDLTNGLFGSDYAEITDALKNGMATEGINSGLISPAYYKDLEPIVERVMSGIENLIKTISKHDISKTSPFHSAYNALGKAKYKVSSDSSSLVGMASKYPVEIQRRREIVDDTNEKVDLLYSNISELGKDLSGNLKIVYDIEKKIEANGWLEYEISREHNKFNEIRETMNDVLSRNENFRDFKYYVSGAAYEIQINDTYRAERILQNASEILEKCSWLEYTSVFDKYQSAVESLKTK